MVSVNVEIKARDADPDTTAARCQALGAVDHGLLHQRDTYLAGRHGRLKLREEDEAAAELIAYRRPDGPEPEESAFVRAPASEPALLREALVAALGETVVVIKRRRLLVWEHVRIHLDDVEGLGSFIELEAMVGPGLNTREEAAEKVARLRSELAISDDALVAVGYSDLLQDGVEALLRAADAVMRTAYAPYSDFKVGAAVRARSGAIYVGANVENVAYPQGQCAEASALGALVAGGETAISAVAVVAEKAEVCPPCGGCRQRLAEFGSADTPVYLGRPGSPPHATTLGELLPLSFGEGRWPIFPQIRGFSSTVPGSFVTAVDEAASVLVERAAQAPRVGVVLGSGLGAVADAVTDPVAVSYEDLPGFPRPTVQGHAGQAVLGRIAGVPVAVLQGRAHLYEGGPMDALRVPVRTLRAAGAEILILTNAAGSLRPDVGPGRLMAITDHINLTGTNVLIGPNDGAMGERFPPMRGAYDPELLGELRAAARALEIPLAEGVYLAVSGPSFETAAEIRAFKILGADAVGMSTVHETTVARHCGLRVLAVSAITNLAEGMSEVPLSHEQTLRDGERTAGDLGRLLLGFLERIGGEDAGV